jgi:hypothetical protein
MIRNDTNVLRRSNVADCNFGYFQVGKDGERRFAVAPARE